MHYKDFNIEVIKDKPGAFKAVIRRSDGRPFRDGGPARITDAYPSEAAAFDQAKRIIDTGEVA